LIRSVVKKELLSSIKNNQEFITAIQLSRILSAVRYNNVIFAKLIDENDIFSNIYLNVFFNHAALIYEGVKTFVKLKPKLENLETYKKYSDKIEKILEDKKDVNSVLNKVFCKIRNKITFHFDEDVIKEIFGIYVDDTMKEQRDIIFLEGKTQKIRDMNYVLAADMDINYIFKFIDEKELNGKDKLRSISKELADLSNLFSEIIELMMAELIKDICEVRDNKRGL
jgi:hypothetical protein